MLDLPRVISGAAMDRVDYAFLHGGGQGSWVWDETIAAMHLQTDAAFGRALALDVPGCGVKRGRDTTTFASDDVVDELLGDITGAGLKDVVLVGHSQAGQMLPLMVERRPELFRRLVYVSCAAPLPGQTIIHMVGEEIGWPLDPEMHSNEERWRVMFCNDMDSKQAEEFVARLGMDNWPDLVTFGTDWRYDHLGAVPSTYVL
jgi:pimeloyl-ACP methyl ester carboxylesterase